MKAGLATLTLALTLIFSACGVNEERRQQVLADSDPRS